MRHLCNSFGFVQQYVFPKSITIYEIKRFVRFLIKFSMATRLVGYSTFWEVHFSTSIRKCTLSTAFYERVSCARHPDTMQVWNRCVLLFLTKCKGFWAHHDVVMLIQTLCSLMFSETSEVLFLQGQNSSSNPALIIKLQIKNAVAEGFLIQISNDHDLSSEYNRTVNHGQQSKHDEHVHLTALFHCPSFFCLELCDLSTIADFGWPCWLWSPLSISNV